MSVITISRQLGSLGTEIAQAVANHLGYQYVNKEKIGKALAGFGLPEIAIEKLDEKKPPFWESWVLDRKRFSLYIQMVIYDFAKNDKVVIVGRGGQILLKYVPGVLHVRIVAPFDVRVKRIMERDGLDEKQAARLLRRNDRDSAGFIQSFFDVDWEDPNLYDLVINTQKLSVETAEKMIRESNQSSEIKEGERKASEKLVDLILFHKAEAAIMNVLGRNIQFMNIHVEEAVVILRGEVTSKTDREKCASIVANIEGVKGVNNQLSVIQRYQYGP